MKTRRQPPWLPPIAVAAVLVLAAAGVLAGVVRVRGLGGGPPSALATRGRGLPLPSPGQTSAGSYLFTPSDLRAAYDLEPLYARGFTGKGQTVIVVVSYGSPTLQTDVATFCQQYGLPPANVMVLAPLGTHAYNPSNPDMRLWARETEADVEIVHAIAPDAAIVVLTSPVDETQGTTGLPEFLQLEQYALAQHLGSIVSQSWGASEVTLDDPAGRAVVERFDQFYYQATTQAGMTFLAASGDHGATDWADAAMTSLSPYATTNFPASDPLVTAVGGTTLARTPAGYTEVAWSGSGGGYSVLFDAPSYQGLAPYSGRGVPDVAAIADWQSGLRAYELGTWRTARGTSESTPLWAGLVAIADQMAGRPLGNINPALYALTRAPRTAGDVYDITSGNNSYTGGGIHVAGYSAAPGWDAVTGLGAPNAARLLPDLIGAVHA